MASLTAAGRHLLRVVSCYLYKSGTATVTATATDTDPPLSPAVQRWAREVGLHLRGEEMRAAEIFLCAPPPRSLHRSKEEAVGSDDLGTRSLLVRAISAPALPHALKGAEELGTRLFLNRGFCTPAPPRAVHGFFGRSFTGPRPINSPLFVRAGSMVSRIPTRSFTGGPLCQGTMELIVTSGEDFLTTNMQWAVRTWHRMNRSQRTALVQRGAQAIFFGCCALIAYREKALDKVVKDRARKIALPAIAVNDFNKSASGRNTKAEPQNL